MAINIKFTKFDNTPWGFRLAGGSDFPQPLTVIRVTEGSLGECMGLKVGDVVVRLNDQSIINLTHGQAHEALVHAGNNFVLGVQREEEARKAAEAISEETIVPYKIALADLPPVFPEQILKEETVIERYEEENIVVEPLSAEDEIRKEEEKLEEEKPVDANSEIVANKNLTDDEIAQLILEEEELLSDKGLLGVNFKKLRPRASILKDSKVLEELQNIAIAEPERVQELKRTSTFLQKPQRPIPKVKNEPKVEEDEGETYKVVIKKQDKKTVIARLVEKGLLPPGSESTIIKTPEPPEPSETTTSATQEFVCRAEQEGKSDSRPASKAEETEEKKSDEVDEIEAKERPEFKEEDRPESCKARLTQDEQTVAEEDSSVSISDPVAVKTNNKEKIKQLVSTEISLEQQLENVQRQLLALKQLPSEIENHLKIVSEQLHMIMELSGVQRSFGNGNGGCRGLSENSMLRQKDEEELKQQEEDTDEEDEEFTETYDYIEEIACLERRTSSRSTPQVIESSDDEGEMEEEEAETKELDGMISVKSAEEGSRVKKFIVSYETKVLKSPSPAPSHGSFEPDPKLSPKDQVIQELQERVHKKGKKHSQELWPQAKQLELTQGRRWRCPNDFFNDEMIAEVLTCQAEVIRGKAMGVNFKKYEKTNLPNYDYLMNSSVYKMIHKMEREPKRGIPVRPAKVNAAEDIIERVKSPALSIIDDRSARSVSH
ncbi:PREDICTED: glutamic acid-rich protein-like isoform X3 [Trachymyrmex septentrionalis]|uniref:glutamic acid-rich protein-like isoform X3 n=1 Tax=Trachymyrmex septentrionalis TaxID=34720 RepID=UPI00084F50DB|nr:PREDICTED: glutamic acid-rich protein-like isoform X3 [Trachymyrmex septentrionalis]